MAPFKSPGIDGIYPVLLQKGIHHLMYPLQKIYRASLVLALPDEYIWRIYSQGRRITQYTLVCALKVYHYHPIRVWLASIYNAGQSATDCNGSGWSTRLVSPWSCASLLSTHHVPLQLLAAHLNSATTVERSQHPTDSKNNSSQASGWLPPDLNHPDSNEDHGAIGGPYFLVSDFP